jgi:hypothetical protein
MSFFSIGHAEILYTDFLDTGTFFQFLSIRDNYLVLKTSDYFSLLKLTPQKLIINPIPSTSLPLDVPLSMKLTYIDINYRTAYTQVNLTVVSQQSKNAQVYRLVNDTQRYQWNCGDSNVGLKIDVDSMYSGRAEKYGVRGDG